MMTPNRASAARAATSVPKEAAPTTLAKLRDFLENARMKEKVGPHAFAAFEKELHERMMEAERDIVAAEMSRLDVDADAVVIDGKVHRRVLRQSQTYMTSAGEVVVERTLYKDRKDEDGRCVSPMELTIGVIGDFWTPRAAEQALWVVTQMTPKKSAELFERVGNMGPSKSSLDRLPKIVADRWEDDREAFEAALRGALVIPEGAASIAVSLDGVLAPIDGANSPTEVRARATEEGRMSKGPAGYREASCATIAFCDDKGDLLGAIRMARAPEAKKKTLKEMLSAEVAAVLQRAAPPEAREDRRRRRGQLAIPLFRQAARRRRGRGLLPRERAPPRGARRRVRRWDARHAASIRDSPRHAARRGGRRGQDHSRAQAPREQASAQGIHRAGARVLPKAQEAHALLRIAVEGLHDRLGHRRGRLQDDGHAAPQAERHALEHCRRSGDPHA